MTASHRIIDLDRRFRREVNDYDPEQEDLHAVLSEVGDRKNGEGWSEVLENRVSVIRGDAGAGKTTELQEQARAIRKRGGAAFVFRLDDLAEGKFEAAFYGADDAQSCAAWRSRGGEAWIFLDALDDVRLISGRVEAPLRRAFDTLRLNLRGMLRVGNARLVISTRPAEWHHDVDVQTVQDHFRRLEEGIKVEPVVFRIIALDRARMTKLLGVLDVDVAAVLASIDHAQAAGLFRHPLDIKLLAHAWRDAVLQGKRPDQAFVDRTDLFNRAVDSQLREIGADEPRLNMSLARARVAAERLAAVSVLTGRQDLNVLPDAKPGEGVDALAALGSFERDWKPLESRQLLATALFTPGSGDMLRFAHREVRDFLAARFFAAAIERSGGSLDPIAPLRGRAFDVEVVPDSSVGVLAWLLALSPPVKTLVSRLRPEILIQGGDPVRLTDADRILALSSIVNRIGDRNFTGLWLAEQDLERFATPALEPAVGKLLEQTQSRDALYILVSLAHAGAMAGLEGPLLKVAIDKDQDDGVRARAIEALAEFGEDASRKKVFDTTLAEYAAATGEVDHTRGKLIGEALRAAYPKVIDHAAALSLIRCVARERRNFHTCNEDRYRAALSAAPLSDRPLWIVALDALLREPVDPSAKDAPDHIRISMRYRLLMPALAELTSVAIEAGAVSPSVLDAVETCQFGAPGYELGTLRDETMKRLRRLLAERPQIVAELFWRRAQRFMRDGAVRWHRAFDGIMRGEGDQGLSSTALVEHFIATLNAERDPERARMAGEAAQYAYSYLPLDGRGTLWTQIQKAKASSASPKLRKDAALARSPRLALVRWMRRQRDRVLTLHRRRVLPKWWARRRSKLRWKTRRGALREGTYVAGFVFASQKAVNQTGQEAVDRAVEVLGEEYRAPLVDGYRRIWRTIDLDREDGWGDIISNHGLDLEPEDVIKTLAGGERDRALEVAVRRLAGLRGWAVTLIRANAEPFRKLATEGLAQEAARLVRDDVYSHGGLIGPLVHAEDADRDLFQPIVFEFTKSAPHVGWQTCRLLANYLAADPRAKALANADLARRRFFEAISEGATPRAWVWARLWLHMDAENAWTAISPWLNKFREPLDRDGILFLSEMHEVSRQSDDYDGYLRKPNVLAELVKVAYAICPVAQDLEHEDGYSPGVRDRAQDERNRYLRALTEMPTNAARAALQSLADDPQLVKHRDHFLYQLEQQLELSTQRQLLTDVEALKFVEQETAVPATRAELFALVSRHIGSALIRLRDGDDDEGRVFREKDTDEDDLRNWLAGRLRDLGKGVYAVVRDPKVSKSKRPDIWLGTLDDHVRVVCELKIAENWSGTELPDLLQTQVVEQYLGEARAAAGIYLVVRCKPKQQTWIVDHVPYPLAALGDVLQLRADALVAEKPGVDQLGVIVFDLA